MAKRHLISRENAVANLRDALRGMRIGTDLAILTRSDNYLAGKFMGLTPRGNLTIQYGAGNRVDYAATAIKAVDR